MPSTIRLIVLVLHAEREEYWLHEPPRCRRSIAVGQVVPSGMTLFGDWQRSYTGVRWIGLQVGSLQILRHKKSPPGKPGELEYYVIPGGIISSNCTLTYLSPSSTRKELAPSPPVPCKERKEGCQGFKGPVFPQPFLISICKNLHKYTVERS